MGLQNTGKFRADKSSKYEGGAGNRLNKVFLHLSEWFIQFVCCFSLVEKKMEQKTAFQECKKTMQLMRNMASYHLKSLEKKLDT